MGTVKFISEGSFDPKKCLVVKKDTLGKFIKNISNYSSIEELELSGVGLEEIPDSVFQLKNLRSIDLSFNRIRKFPEKFSVLKNLQVLNFSDNQLTDNVFEGSEGVVLECLESVSFHGNSLSKIPDFVFNSLKLELLDLSSNRISEVSPVLGKLQGLYSLFLNCNQIESLPDCFRNLGKVYEVYLNGNRLSALPSSLISKSKSDVTLYDNPFSQQDIDRFKAVWVNSFSR